LAGECSITAVLDNVAREEQMRVKRSNAKTERGDEGLVLNGT
jgi:hypothetical protein